MNKEFENYLKNLGKKLVLVLRHDEIDQSVKNVIEDIILQAFEESENLFICHPDLIENAFPLIIENLKPEYGKAIADSLNSILKSLDTEFEGLEVEENDGLQIADGNDKNIVFNSKRIVAEWLVNTRKNGETEVAGLIEKLIGIFKLAFELPMETPQNIVDCLAHFDEEIRDDRDYEPANEAAGIMGKLALKISDDKMMTHLINVYDFWMNPEGGDIDYSEIKGRLLAETFLDIMENPNVPARISDAMLAAMADVFNEDLTLDQKQKLPELEDDRDADYIDKLFRAYTANRLSKESEQVEDDGLKTLSAQISEIVSNPLLPPSLYNAIVNEISEISEKLCTPENILHNLKKLQKVS